MPRLLPKTHCQNCGARIPTRDVVPVKLTAKTGESWEQRWCKRCVREERKKPWLEVE